MTETRSYHGQPVLKRPTWTWEIPCYLFTGGLAGASTTFAYVCDRRGEPELARRAWAAALGGLVVSPLLLVSDLGRPARFLNMLRVFKVTSPMSVGSWILILAGTSTAPATARAWLPALGLPPRIAAVVDLSGRVTAPVAALLGLPLASYTAALLTATSVPVWHEARRDLPFVFVAGAAVSAGAAVVLTSAPEQAAPARRLALAAGVLELALTEAMEHRLGDLGEAYRRGAAPRFGWAARGCLASGTALLAVRGRRSRRDSAVGAALLLAGAFCTRWSVFKAGFESVDDPAFVVDSQRARMQRGEDHGASRHTSSASGDPALGTPALRSRSVLREPQD